MLIQLGRHDEARLIYQTMVERNPENWAHYDGLERTIRPANEEEKLAIYIGIAEKYNRAAAPKRIAMNFASGKIFNIRNLSNRKSN